MEQAKKDFLKTVIFDQTEYEKLIDRIYAETKDSETNDAYIFLISQNAHKTQEDIKDFQVEDFLKEVYKNWYGFFQKYTLTTNNNELTDLIQADLKKLRTEPRFLPENIEKNGGYSNFFIHQFKNEFKTEHWHAVKNQGFFPYFNSFMDGFLHIYSPINDDFNRDVRLYVNLESKNILPVATMVVDYCYENKLPMHIKFAPRDIRNDTFIIYTTYDYAQTYVNLLKQIKSKHPQFFANTEKKNPLLATIEGAEFIGFGEDPKYKLSSFNSEREIIFKMCIEEQKESIKKILNNSQNVVQNRYGEVLSIDDYLIYFLKRKLSEKVAEEIEKVSATKRKYTLDKIQVEKYLEGQKKILMGITAGRFENRFQDMLSAYKNYLHTPVIIDEHIIGASNVYFKLSTNIPEYAGQQKIEGKEEYHIKIPVSIQDINGQLLSLFKEEEKTCKQRLHDPKIQKKYYDENHISTTYPFLNLETEQEIEKENKQTPAF